MKIDTWRAIVCAVTAMAAGETVAAAAERYPAHPIRAACQPAAWRIDGPNRRGAPSPPRRKPSLGGRRANRHTVAY